MAIIHPKDAMTIWNKRWRLSRLYSIRTEDRAIRRLSLTPSQDKLMSLSEAFGHRGLRLINLKGRKEGLTTFWCLFNLDDCLFTPNTVTQIIAHKIHSVQTIFKIVKLAYKTAPAAIDLNSGRTWYKPEANYDNKNELTFDKINSSIRVGIESRGDTINNLHISEAAQIPNADERLVAATLPAVPNRATGSNIMIESTANGFGGWYHDTWQEALSGENEFNSCFFPWWGNPKNRITPPSDFVPDELDRAMIARVAEYYGTTLTPEQVFWWRMKRKSQKKKMDQEYPSTPDDAFMTSDMMVFDGAVLRQVSTPPAARIWRKVHIWREPVPGRTYIVGADPAEGVGGDRSTIEVVDAETLEQVAEYASSTIPPAKFAKTIARVGEFYNFALVAPERNNHGHLVLDRLKDIYRGRIFMQTHIDERTAKPTKKLGWLTTDHTRDLMLDELVDLVEEGSVKINSPMLKSEMMTFVTSPDGKREAKTGMHDDRVMALAIAVKVARMPKTSFGIYTIS